MGFMQTEKKPMAFLGSCVIFDDNVHGISLSMLGKKQKSQRNFLNLDRSVTRLI